MRMGELESSSGSVGVRRSGRLVNKRSNGLLKVIDVDDDDDDDDADGEFGEVGMLEVVEEEEWEPGTERKRSQKKGVERRTKRGEKGTGVTSIKQEEVDGKLTQVYRSRIRGLEYGEKRSAMMGFDVVEAVSHGLGSVNLSREDKGNSRDAVIVRNAVKSLAQDGAKSCHAVRSFLGNKVGNSRSSEIVVNAVPQEWVVVDPSKEGIMERPVVRTVLQRAEVVNLSSSGSSDDGDEGDDYTEDESAGEQEAIDTTLSREDAALFAELTKVLREGGDLKKLKVDHLKAYLRFHRLRMSGVKAILLSRVEDHLKLKDGQAEGMFPKTSFSIDCKGDVCLGDTVLFLQHVYDSFDIVSRSAKPLGKRWVAGKVVHESYGAGKQQHTFTIEVFWSTGTRPFYVMRPVQIKGRNLYGMKTMRQPWSNEAERQKALDEKHARGAEARAQRRAVTASGSRGRSRSRPSSRGHSNPRDQGREPREPQSILPTIPPSHNYSIQHERNRAQQINVHQGSTVAHSHTRNCPAESDRIPPTIPPFQNSMQHERAHTERHGWAHTEQQYGRTHTEQHGRTYTESHVYRANTGAQGVLAYGQGAVHVHCSTRGCEKTGAKHCISRSCASCCYRNGSTRGSCPRHL